MSGYPNYNAPPGYQQPGYAPQGPQRPPPQRSSGGNGCLIAAIVVLVVVGIPTLLLCAGVGFLFYFVKSEVDRAQVKAQAARSEFDAVGKVLAASAVEEKPVTNVDEAIAALGLDHWSMPQRGADWFIANPVDAGKRAVAVQALLTRMEAPHKNELSLSCIKALRTWGSKENAPAVAKMLKRFAIDRAQICDVLALWKDPSVATEIAAVLDERGADGDAAEKALIEIGSGCEAAVRTQLDLERKTAHARAERILATYGVDVPDAIITARLATAKSGDGHYRRVAIQSLATLPLKADRQEEVARALDAGVLGDDHSIRDESIKALVVWADKKSAASLAKFIKSETFVNKQAVKVLTNLKDPTTLDALVFLLDNAFISDLELNQAFVAFGADAEKAVLPAMNDQRHRAQERARAILAELGAKPDVMLTQTLKDLSSTDDQRVKSALEWLAAATIEPQRQAEVADKLGLAMKSIPHHLQAPALNVLVRCNSPGGVLALSELIRDKGEQRQVSEAFHKAGPASEDVLLALLASPDPNIAGYACSGLANYGSERSVMPLKELLRKTGATNKPLSTVARTALDAVQKRTSG